jgi:hypothetical protein
MSGQKKWRAMGSGVFALSIVGCAGHSPTTDSGSSPSSAQQLVCATGPGVTELYVLGEPAATQPVVTGDQVLLAVTESLLRVPVAGGAPDTLAVAEGPTAPVVLDGIAYFQASAAVGLPDAQGKQPTQSEVYAVAVAGGNATPMPSLDTFTPVAADGSSLYLEESSLGFERWTPPSGAANDLPVDAGFLIDGMTIQSDYLYVAGQDIKVGGFLNGVIERVPKAGGSAERIVTGIGHPWNLVADSAALYWSEDPPGLYGVGPGRLARSSLDGKSVATVFEQNATSLVAANGRLYFSLGTEVDSISTTGGATTTIASGLGNAGLLAVADSNVIWVDPYSQALSGTASAVLMTACEPSH